MFNVGRIKNRLINFMFAVRLSISQLARGAPTTTEHYSAYATPGKELVRCYAMQLPNVLESGGRRRNK